MARLTRIALAGAAAVLLAGVGAAALGSRPSTGPCGEPAPAARADAASVFTPYRAAAADGTCLQSYAWTPAGGSVRAAVVVVHGLHDHARRYEPLARALNAAGVAVYAWDHRGHGGSGGARQRVDSVAQLVGDADGAVREAMRRHPGLPVFLHGHSMGGLVAASHAIERGQLAERRLAGVVVSSAALMLPASASAGARAVVGALSTLAPGLGLEAVDEAQIVREAAARAALAGDAVLSREKLPARTVATVLGGIAAIGPRMEQLSLPVLILHGTADRVTEPDGSRELARRAGSADKTLRLYDGALHDLLHEPEGGAVTAEILRFVTARLR